MRGITTVAACVVALLVLGGGISIVTTGAGGSVASVPLADANQQTTTDRPPNTPNRTQEVAPGVTRDGVTDPWELVSAHRTALESTSFTALLIETQRFANGTVRSSLGSRFQRASAVRYYHTQTITGTLFEPERFHAERFADGERVYQLRIINNSTETELVRSGPGGPPASPESVFGPETLDQQETIYSFVSTFDLRVTDQTTRNDTTLYRLESTALEHTATLANTKRVETIENATFTALVAPDGLVHGYRLTYTGEVGNATVTGTERVRFIDVGTTTVRQPAWVGEIATNTTTATSLAEP